VRRRPQELRVVLERVQERLAPADLLAAVQRHWRPAVGDEVADEAWPEAERAGRVTIRCRSSVWSAELTMLEETLLARLNQRLPRGRQARALKFVTATVSSRSPRSSS
jgi:predicted nucleic acid-binding Zn ribbon protein